MATARRTSKPFEAKLQAPLQAALPWSSAGRCDSEQAGKARLCWPEIRKRLGTPRHGGMGRSGFSRESQQQLQALERHRFRREWTAPRAWQLQWLTHSALARPQEAPSTKQHPWAGARPQLRAHRQCSNPSHRTFLGFATAHLRPTRLVTRLRRPRRGLRPSESTSSRLTARGALP